MSCRQGSFWFGIRASIPDRLLGTYLCRSLLMQIAILLQADVLDINSMLALIFGR